MHDSTTTFDVEPWGRQWQPALRAYGLDPTTVSARLISYSENATYLCTHADGARSILRLHRPGFRSVDEVRSEVAWISAIRAVGAVSTPGFRLTAGREPVALFAGAEGRLQHAVLFDHVVGDEPDESSFTEVMRKVGAETAALHRHALAWERPAGFTRPTWDVEHLIGRHSLWGTWRDTPEVGMTPDAEGLLGAAELRVRGRLAQYGVSHGHVGLIHGDLRSTNLLIDGERVNVIDFDDCGLGWYMYDLACSLSFMEHSPDLPEWVDAWLRGYRRQGSLRSEDVEIIPTMIMLRRLLLVAWLETRRDSPLAQQIRGEFVGQSVEVARRYLDGTLVVSRVPTRRSAAA